MAAGMTCIIVCYFILCSYTKHFHRKKMSLKHMKVNLLRLAVNVIIIHQLVYNRPTPTINILLGV